MKESLNLIFVLLIASLAFPQKPVNSLGPLELQDDLLDHLVGKWDMTGSVHGRPTKQTFEAEWVLHHQFVRIYEKSEENIAGTTTPFEALNFIGYDKKNRRYVFQSMSVWGGGAPDALVYGQRTGNEINFEVFVEGKLEGNVRFIWQPESRTWHYVTGRTNNVAVELTSKPAGAK